MNKPVLRAFDATRVATMTNQADCDACAWRTDALAAFRSVTPLGGWFYLDQRRPFLVPTQAFQGVIECDNKEH